MPVTTAQQIYGNNDYIDQINLTYNPEMDFDAAIGFSNLLTKKLKTVLWYLKTTNVLLEFEIWLRNLKL